MKQGFHVCLYKRKGQPIITAFVKGDEVEICMSLDDFKAKVLEEFGSDKEFREKIIAEIGSVTWTFKQETFASQVDKAFDAVTITEQVGKAFDAVILNIKKGATRIV